VDESNRKSSFFSSGFPLQSFESMCPDSTVFCASIVIDFHMMMKAAFSGCSFFIFSMTSSGYRNVM
jgi:hypothetical protein